MALSLRQKRDFYRELARLIAAGRTVPLALEIVAEHGSRGIAGLSRRLQHELRNGATAGEAFTRQSGLIGTLEASVIAAGERGGRLEQSFGYLAEHFQALAQARQVIIDKSLYPLFLVHFGVFVLTLPEFFTGGGVRGYLTNTLGGLGAAYLGILILWGGLQLLRRAAVTSTVVDRLFGWIPLMGGIARSFSLARFCATYELQLQAGVNVLESLSMAARTARSARISSAVAAALPALRRGEQLGPLLAESGAFPKSLVRAIRIGEESGGLDAELKRAAEEFHAEGIRRLKRGSEWLPKLAYLGAVIYLAFRIIEVYRGAFKGLEGLL